MTQNNETIKLAVALRSEAGTACSKQLRREGWLPCVIYDHQGKSRLLKTRQHQFEMLVRQQGGQNLILDLDIEGGSHCKALLKEIQRDNMRDNAIHVDFMEISMTQKLRIDVTIHLIGEPHGVTQQGGVLEHLVRTVEIECLPADIVKEFTLDISGMKVGDRMFVRDLQLDPKYAVLTDANIALATVQLPRVEEEAKPEAATAEGEGEPAETDRQKTAGQDKEQESTKDGATAGKADQDKTRGK